MRKEYSGGTLNSFRCVLVLSFLLAFIMVRPAFAWETIYEGMDTFVYSKGGVNWYCKTVFVRQDDGAESVEAVIYGCENISGSFSLTFPSEVKDSLKNTWTVTGIVSPYEAGENGNRYFSYESDYELAELHFPDTVYNIGYDVFNNDGDNGFGLIYNIELPDNEDLYIDEAAFQMCGIDNGVDTEIVFGSKPVYIGASAFNGCTGIKSITLPEGSETNWTAFEDCCNITDFVNAPDDVYFGEGKCKLQRLVFDQTLTSVRGVSNAYNDNYYPNLTTVTLPVNCTEIGECAFENCSSLTTINNLNWSKLKKVGEQAFFGCKNLKLSNVQWNQEDLTYQFKDSGLVSITLSASVKHLYAGGFTGCPNLTAINVASGNSEFSSVDGILFSNSYGYDSASGSYKKTGKKSLMKYPAGKNIGGKYTIPANVETIGGFSFEGCKLAEVHIPITVEAVMSDLMAYLTAGTPYYAFDNTPNSLAVYVVKGSCADKDVQGIHSNIKYELGPKVPITYNLDGGTNASGNPSSFTAGNAITLKDPSKKGYKFKGWDYKLPYQPSSYDLIEGMTFTATWEKIKMAVKTAKASYAYTGKALKPALTVTFDGKAAKTSEYTASWKKNKAIGEATVTVSGKGKYEGCKATATFKINPAKVKSVKASSKKKKTAAISWKKQAKASKITGYQVQMATDKSFKKNLKKQNVKSNKNNVTIKKLKSKKTYYVRVRAYKKTKAGTYNGSWSKPIKVKIK